ncbi:MAG TPA: WD40 repeat domain-containing protein [Bacteroidia bacterium]|nr:WD40 repeat domain-containing protein [Bacteroidia bacterium]
MNRVVVSSIISIVIIGLMAVGYYYFSAYREKFSATEDALPNDAAIVIRGSIGDLYTSLEKVGVWNEKDSLTVMYRFKKEMHTLLSNTTSMFDVADLLESPQTTIAVLATGARNAELLYLVPSRKELNIDALQKALTGQMSKNKSRTFAGVSIYEIQFSNFKSSFTFAFANGIFIGSFNAGLVEDAIRQQATGKPFGGNVSAQKLYKEVSVSTGTILGLNYPALKKLFSVVISSDQFNELANLEKWAEWSFHNLTFDGNSINASGTVLISDSTQQITDFGNARSSADLLWSVLPDDVSALQIISFKDAQIWSDKNQRRNADNEEIINFIKQLSATETKFKVEVKKDFSTIVGDIGAVAVKGNPTSLLENNSIALLQLKDQKKSLTQLLSLSKKLSKNKEVNAVEKFRNHEIRFLNCDGLLPAMFGNAFTVIRKNYFTTHNGFIIFANKPSQLRGFIDDVEDNEMFNKSEVYQQNKSILSESISYALFLRPTNLNSYFQSVANSNTLKALAATDLMYKLSSFYYYIQPGVSGKAECNFRVVIQQKQEQKVSEPKWSFFADSAIHCGPFIFNSDNGISILFQDSTKSLICLDGSGNVSWKTTINGFINGKISQTVNDQLGLLQLVCSTDDSIYMFNQNGVLPARYPFKLPFKSRNGVVASPNANVLFVAGENNLMYVFDPGSRPSQNWNTVQLNGNLFNASIDASGRFVYIMDGDKLRLYSTDGKLILSMPSAEYKVNSIQWVNDSVPSLFMLNNKGNIVVWNTDGTYKIASGDSAFDMAATCGTGTARMWYTIKGKELKILDYTFKAIQNADLSKIVFNAMQLFDTGNEILCILKDAENIAIYRGDLKILPQVIPAVSFAVKTFQGKTYLISRTGNGKLILYVL